MMTPLWTQHTNRISLLIVTEDEWVVEFWHFAPVFNNKFEKFADASITRIFLE